MHTLALVLESKGSAFGKLMHKLGIPDWVCWTFLGGLVVFYIYRAWQRHTYGE